MSWQRYCTVLQHQQWVSAKVCGVEQRAPPVFGRVAITLGIGPHSSIIYLSFLDPATLYKRYYYQKQQSTALYIALQYVVDLPQITDL